LVQDYRKLNQVTIKDKIPLPLIGEVINKLKRKQIISTNLILSGNIIIYESKREMNGRPHS